MEPEETLECRFGGIQIIPGFGAFGTIEQGRGVASNLDLVRRIQTAGEQARRREQERNRYQIEPSHACTL
jgi:hypothetical protein